ncbi:MAG TPA: FtsX-like permease family protein [Clostridiales bacterium]|nr:FtsX-like permease family protein [Clostridiales bacterium]
MNIMNALTLRHLKLNKKRTVVTIIGVILSVSMITAVPTIMTSLLSMMQRSVIADTGNWHVLYADILGQNVNIVMNDKNTDTAALSKDVGYAVLRGSKNKNKPYLFIKSYDEQGFINFGLKLIEGRFPQSSNEIVISSHVAENGGVEYKVGDVLKLDIGQRYMVEDEKISTLGQTSGFKEASDDNKGEKFAEQFTKEYTVTGIISRPGFEPYWAPGYTVISYLEKNELTPNDTVNVSVAWKSINKKANEHANKLFESINTSGSSSITYNRQLLRYYGIIGEDLLTMLYTLAAIVTLLIITGSVALIYNSFAISISERSRHLGMLASVGATKKQKSRSVFFEGFVVGIIGIPLGVFFGTLGIGVTFVLVQPLIEGLNNTGVKLTLVTSPGTIVVAVLLSLLTIFVSAYVPARRASKVSPVDALRQSQDIKLTSRAVKTSRLTRKIFGFEAELGLKNLKRNSRRYKATVFSLVISIVLFLSVSSLSLLTRKSVDIVSGGYPYDVRVFVVSSATAQEKKDFYTAITKMAYADKSVIEQTMNAVFTADGKLIPDQIKEIIEPNYKDIEPNYKDIEPNYKENKSETNTNTFDMEAEIKSIDEAALERYAKEIGVDPARLKDTENPCGVLVNTVTIKVGNKYSRMKHFNIEQGQKLKFIHHIYDGKSSGEPQKPGELGGPGEPEEYGTILEIAALADSTPIGETTFTDPLRAVFIVSEEVYAHMQAKLPEESHNTRVLLLIKSSNPSKLVKGIEEYQKQTSIASVDIFDVAALDKANRQFETFIFVFFYGFVALITAICAANIFNTISTSISLRKREFAMLKSVGMTPEGFNKMINYESLFYGIKALLYGLPISFGIMYLIYRVLSNSFGFAFAIPWSSVLAAVIVVFALVGSTMLYASSKIKKENIIDALKTENI